MTYILIILLGTQYHVIGTDMTKTKCEKIRQWSIDRNNMRCVKDYRA